MWSVWLVFCVCSFHSVCLWWIRIRALWKLPDRKGLSHLFDHFQFILIHGHNIPGSYAILFLKASDFTSVTSHIFDWPLFTLLLHLFILSRVISLLFSIAYWAPTDLRNYLSVSYSFAFSYCSWGSQGKKTEVVCHSLLQWTRFCQNSPPWPIHLGWPYTAWLIISLS